MAITIAEFADSILRPQAHALLRKRCADVGAGQLQTEALIRIFDNDPVLVSDFLYGIELDT